MILLIIFVLITMIIYSIKGPKIINSELDSILKNIKNAIKSKNIKLKMEKNKKVEFTPNSKSPKKNLNKNRNRNRNISPDKKSNISLKIKKKKNLNINAKKKLNSNTNIANIYKLRSNLKKKISGKNKQKISDDDESKSSEDIINSKNLLNNTKFKKGKSKKHNSTMDIKINKKNNNDPPKKSNKINIILSSSSQKNQSSTNNIIIQKNNLKTYLTETNPQKKEPKLKKTKSRNNNKRNYYIKNEASIIKTSPRKNNIGNKKEIINKKINYIIQNNLNDEELNSLPYKKAIKLDKRTYFQYYWALLKKKQIILFAFVSSGDYNIRVIKIALLIVSFSLYFTINGFFFTDETMHKVYEDNGSFNILHQIPQILYSSIVSIFINILLKQLSLSERDIIKVKHEQNYSLAIKKSEKTKKFLLIKFGVFFSLSIILMSFFWYFNACFCVVYKNTQFILIKNTLVSFCFTMLYPFGLYLIPGVFRIPALRAKTKDKKCLFILAGIIALI